jgi:hypothetical protein
MNDQVFYNNIRNWAGSVKSVRINTHSASASAQVTHRALHHQGPPD